MKIKSFLFGPFQTNTYVVAEDDGRALLIDPACSNPYEQQALLRYVQLEQLRVEAIIATHGHLDHLWGAKWATDEWQLPVLMHEADIPMAERMPEQYELFGIRRTAEAFPIEGISNFKSQISNMSILSTPGHTPGSVCLYWEKDKVLLSGDTLFCMGYGRTDLPGGDMGQLMDSLERLLALPAAVQVYPGHGDATTIGAERRWG